MKKLFANDMETRKLTPVIASHNLRELEDICDHVGILHKGGDSPVQRSGRYEDEYSLQSVRLYPGTEPEQIRGLEIIRTEKRRPSPLTVRGRKRE